VPLKSRKAPNGRLVSSSEPRLAIESVICVEVRGAAYGIPVAEVQEVIDYRPPTRLFHAPPALAGIFSLRGEVLPIVELSALLEPTPSAPHETAAFPRVVVVRETSGARRRVGLKVDALLGLRDVPREGHREVPPGILARLGGLVIGMVSEPPPAFAVLCISAILSSPAFRELRDISNE
jgi:chemotaxis signal transduction protein